MRKITLLLVLVALMLSSVSAHADDGLKGNCGYPLGFAESFNQSVDKAKLTAIFMLMPDAKRETYTQLSLGATDFTPDEIAALALGALQVNTFDVTQPLPSMISVNIAGVIEAERLKLLRSDRRLLSAVQEVQMQIKATLDTSAKLNRAYIDGSIDKATADNELQANRLDARREMDMLNAYWYLAENDNTDAVRILDGVLATDKTYYPALLWRGIAWYYLDKYDLALSDLQVLSSQKDYADAANYYIGNCYYVRNDYDKAIAAYLAAITAHPDAKEYFYLGNCYRKQNKYDDAILAYSKCIDLDKTYTGAYTYRGDCYLYSAKYDLAASDYDVVIKIGKPDGYLYFNRGAIYMKQGDVDSAISCFEKTTQLLPNYADGFYNKALAYDQKIYLLKQAGKTSGLQTYINSAVAAYKQFIALADPKRQEVTYAKSRISALNAKQVLDIY